MNGKPRVLRAENHDFSVTGHRLTRPRIVVMLSGAAVNGNGNPGRRLRFSRARSTDIDLALFFCSLKNLRVRICTDLVHTARAFTPSRVVNASKALVRGMRCEQPM
jgi:hypothetical protein